MAETASESEPVLRVEEPREPVAATSSGTTSPEANTTDPKRGDEDTQE